MGRKKKVKEVKETKKTIIILAIIAIFLVGVILFQTITSFRQFDLHRCIIQMVAIQEAMRKMDEEFLFRFNHPQQSDKYILDALQIYFKFGKSAFYQDEQGYLHYKSRAELERLPVVNRNDNFFSEYAQQCPAGGTYRLEASPGSKYFNIYCSKHGGIEQPDSKGRYVYTGNFAKLQTTKAELGIESRLVVPSPFKIGKEIIILIPKPQPLKKITESTDTETSPVL